MMSFPFLMTNGFATLLLELMIFLNFSLRLCVEIAIGITKTNYVISFWPILDFLKQAPFIFEHLN